MTIEINEEHLWNANGSIALVDDGIVTCIKDEHPLKSARVKTSIGNWRSIDLNFLQSLNVPASISFCALFDNKNSTISWLFEFAASARIETSLKINK